MSQASPRQPTSSHWTPPSPSSSPPLAMRTRLLEDDIVTLPLIIEYAYTHVQYSSTGVVCVSLARVSMDSVDPLKSMQNSVFHQPSKLCCNYLNYASSELPHVSQGRLGSVARLTMR